MISAIGLVGVSDNLNVEHGGCAMPKLGDIESSDSEWFFPRYAAVHPGVCYGVCCAVAV